MSGRRGWRRRGLVWPLVMALLPAIAPTAQAAGKPGRAAPGESVRAAPFTPDAPELGQRLVILAWYELQRGVRERPAGTNDSPDIARYRTATHDAYRGGDWCAYFVSYIAAAAGAPVMPRGRGEGGVDRLRVWATRNGLYTPVAQARPRPGDLVFFDEHIGIVWEAGPRGIRTIEGNSRDAVRTHRYGPAGAKRPPGEPDRAILGYARLRERGPAGSRSTPAGIPAPAS